MVSGERTAADGRPRVLVIRPGALGDTLLTEPVVAALRAAHKAAIIELAGRTDYLPLLVGQELADACTSTDSAAFTSLFGEDPLELPTYDIVLAYLPDPDGALAAKLRGRNKRAVVFDPRPAEGGTVHIVDHLLGALAPLGICAARSRPRLTCRNEWSAAARALLERRRDYAVIHPGSGGRPKLWAPEKWAAVISALWPLEFVLTCGPADDEVANDVLARVAGRSRVVAVRGRPVTTLAGVLAGAKLYLGCDSGVTHLAAALGVPTVAVFGPTDPQVWAPRGPNVRVVVGRGATRSVAVANVLDAVPV